MSLKVLYVEDNPQNMRLVRKILTNAGYKVIEAVNGLSCLALVETDRPDVILMDINLPDVDGLEITKRLKANPRFSDVPVVALTANAMYGDRERCIEAGCDGYLSKPILKRELLGLMANYARQLLVSP